LLEVVFDAEATLFMSFWFCSISNPVASRFFSTLFKRLQAANLLSLQCLAPRSLA